METFLDIVPLIAGSAFIAWLLRELVLSQKSKESAPVVEQLCLHVQMHLNFEPGSAYMHIYGDTLEELQKHLNNVVFSSILTARVYYKGQVVYVMNKAGVLVAV